MKRLSELKAICEQAEAEAHQRAAKERALNAKIKAFRAMGEEQIKRTADAESWLQESPSVRPAEKGLELVKEETESNLESVEAPWLVVEYEHAEDEAETTNEDTNGHSASGSAVVEVIEFTRIPEVPDEISSNGAEGELEPLDINVAASLDPGQRLSNPNSSERAAALADLAEISSEDSFGLIARSFDDPAADVRNAAARALYDLHPDRAASFTRALREATPERRRKIGAAIAGSGLAANAINNLSGDGRDKTYDAFSILFLMAKAGEVQPLIQAISKHEDMDVRLTAVKVLALSNQPQVLPAFRSLAAREPLPPEIHAAVMDAIYAISNQTREGSAV
jgi:HEAT repeat protein